MNNPLMQFMQKHQKGNRPAFLFKSFLSLQRIEERGLPFNDIMKDSHAMTKAALMSFEYGFESTVLPFDLNVEAEILGAKVQYHEGFDGNPVYPTIAEKPVSTFDDIKIPDNLSERGRMPAILETIHAIKEQAQDKGALGMFMPGPFTLAGQLMDMDKMLLMLLKQPEPSRQIFERLTEFLLKLKEVYIRSGVEFITIMEGGGAAISPKSFRGLLLPFMQDLFSSKEVPHIIYLSGGSKKIVELILTCNPDGIILQKESDIESTKEILPESMPRFCLCGSYEMLANTTPEEVTENVRQCLDKGFTAAGPPADVYPPAKIENIEAFVKAMREYNG